MHFIYVNNSVCIYVYICINNTYILARIHDALHMVDASNVYACRDSFRNRSVARSYFFGKMSGSQD